MSKSTPKPAKPKRTKVGASPKKPQITTEDRHRAFAREYVASGFNATHAAIAAGYSENTAASQGARLLRDAKVQEYVTECKARVVERAEVKAEDVVRRLNQMLMADPRELVEVAGRQGRRSEGQPSHRPVCRRDDRQRRRLHRLPGL